MNIRSCCVVFVALLVMTGCDRGRDTAANASKFGIQKVLANYPPVLARDRALFVGVGLKVELVQFDSANDALDALLADRIISDAVIPFQLLFEIEGRSPGSLRCFGAMIATAENPLEVFIVRADSNIQTEGQLATARIGVFPGTFAETLTRLALGTSVTIKQIPQAAQAEALVRGEVDALVAYDPLATHLIHDAKAKLFAKGLWEKKLGRFAVGGYCLSKKTVENHRDSGRKVQQALMKSVEIFQSDPGSALSALSQEFQLRPELINQYSVARAVFGKEMTPELIRETYVLYRRAGIVSVDIDPTRLILNDL